MDSSAFHCAHFALRAFITSIPTSFPLPPECDSPVIYFTHSYSPAYPRDNVLYPLWRSLWMLSPLFSLARAPYLHRIGATSAVARASLSCLHCNALWQSSVLSSKISQNFVISPPDDSATSGRFIVTTPWLTYEYYYPHGLSHNF